MVLHDQLYGIIDNFVHRRGDKIDTITFVLQFGLLGHFYHLVAGAGETVQAP